MGILTVRKAKRFWGEIRPPSDKSLTHRAYLLSAISNRGGIIENPLRADDCDATLNILRDLGADCSVVDNTVRFRPSPLHSSAKPLHCGNSGTTMRLLCGLLAGQGIRAELTGDESLSRRPMLRVVAPLREMGANIEGEFPPIAIQPAELHGIRYSSPIASAQIKSALILAGLFADGETSISEPFKSRDHTERMLAAAGCDLSVNNLLVTVRPSRPNKVELSVPGDISSAAFFMAAAALLGGPVTLKQVGLNPTRTGVLQVLAAAGVSVHITETSVEMGEPVGDISVAAPGVLRPFTIEGSLVPKVIDEIPVLAVLATQCEGETTIRNAQELRVKESDRIESIASGLDRMGAFVDVHDDGMTITGPTPLSGCEIQAKQDHRLVMAFAVAGLIAEGETTVTGAETVKTSFPNFESELRRLSES